MKKFISNQQVLAKLNENDHDIQELIRPFQTVRGSLNHDNIIPELPLLQSLSIITCFEYGKLCKLLPSVKESCLNSEELSNIQITLRSYFGTAYVRTLALYRYSSTLLFQGTVYGSLDSYAQASSMVHVMTASIPHCKPAVVRKFLSVSVIIDSPNGHKEVTVFLAGINWLFQHEHKQHFGSPVEIIIIIMAKVC